jgi:dephospho-CoA kinase
VGDVLLVAVTGGIGAGKSTVSRRLGELGAVVVDSDVLAREVVAPGTPGLHEVVAAFGDGIVTADGALDRAALAGVVFADPAARRRLEAIVHPRVRAAFAAAAASAAPDAVVVNDIPLLVELRTVAEFHLVLGVTADPEARVVRLQQRGLTEADARARITAQIDDARRRPLCDAWLANDGDAAALEGSVSRLWSERVVPFEQALRTGALPDPSGWPPDADRREAAIRASARVGRAVAATGAEGLVQPRTDTGSAASEPARADVQVQLRTGGPAAQLRVDLRGKGFLPAVDDPTRYVAADPAQPVTVALGPVDPAS